MLAAQRAAPRGYRRSPRQRGHPATDREETSGSVPAGRVGLPGRARVNHPGTGQPEPAQRSGRFVPAEISVGDELIDRLFTCVDRGAKPRKPENIVMIGVARYEDAPVSYTHLRAHETVLDLVCRLLLEKKKREQQKE